MKQCNKRELRKDHGQMELKHNTQFAQILGVSLIKGLFSSVTCFEVSGKKVDELMTL